VSGDRVAADTVAGASPRVRASAAEHVLILLPARGPLAAELARASLALLAVERAPLRVNALAAADGCDPADAEAAARFLEGARSTTGQLLEVG